MKRGIAKNATALAVAMCFAGCATAPGQQNGVQRAFNDTFNNQDPCSNNARNIGIAVGAGLGAILGAVASHKDKGAIVAGLAVGGLVGGLIGADMDHRRCDLAKVARQYNLDLAMATIASDGSVINDAQMQTEANPDAIKKASIGSVVSIRDQTERGGHFESNSDVLTLRAQQYFAAIADAYNPRKIAEQIQDPKARKAYLEESRQHKLLLLGHTDDTGGSRLNADLSERRAKAVAEFLEQHGIARDAIFYQGAGEVYPIADNNTEVGREQNRRVEIVELADDANFQKFLAARKPNYQFYRDDIPAAVNASKIALPTDTSKSKLAVRDKSSAKATAIDKAVPAVAQDTTTKPTSASTQNIAPSIGHELDFGGIPLSANGGTIAIGKVAASKPWFLLISSAYADEPAVMSDCSKDRPRVNGAVRALKTGAVYSTIEHVPSLYGKTWVDKVNGNSVVINKVAVLVNEASLAQFPELKVYTNFNPKVDRNPKPDVFIKPEVNTYLGESGILYRIFAKGAGGMQCIDILYNKNGGLSAKAGKIVYAHDQRLYVAEFKPTIVN
jgi:outer membrane protein OmpA-like peptidoglycan-associated protein